MEPIFRKEISLTAHRKKNLERMAKKVNVSLKEYIERILDRHIITYLEPQRVPKLPLTPSEVIDNNPVMERNQNNQP